MAIKRRGKLRMTDNSRSTGSFDLDRVRELIEIMEQHGVTEVNLRKADERWVLRRGPAEVINMLSPGGYAPPSFPAPTTYPSAPAAMLDPASSASAPAMSGSTAAASDNTLLIKSPTVGTYYAAPTPSDPPFVKVGFSVQPDTIVCVIEAMKVFNQIPAEVSGTITEILVKNGDPVEYGQALFRVKP
jgi:acetyl-CoA carboxylase biotin carboxyl carrier protein